MAARSDPAAPARPTCRVCLSSDVLQVAIYGAYARAHKIPVKIRVCLPISIDRTDNHPKTICHRCVTKLDEYYDYYCNSLTTQRILNGEELSFQRYLRRKVDSRLTAAVERRIEREAHGPTERVVPAPEITTPKQQQQPNCTYVVERTGSPRPKPSSSFLDIKHGHRKRKPKPASQTKKIHSTYTVSPTLFD